MGTMRACRECRQEYPATPVYFALAKANRGGIDTLCKSCLREKSRRYRTAHPDKMRAARTAWQKRQPPEYTAWRHMIERCTNPRCKVYGHYGGRGISVCERWLESFRAFLDDMGPRPSQDHEIDRVNNNGDYEPSNCRWATRGQQVRNTRRTRLVTFRGETKPLVDWCEELGLKYNTVAERLRKGNWTIEQALTLQPQKGKKPEPIG